MSSFYIIMKVKKVRPHCLHFCFAYLCHKSRWDWERRDMLSFHYYVSLFITAVYFNLGHGRQDEPMQFFCRNFGTWRLRQVVCFRGRQWKPDRWITLRDTRSIEVLPAFQWTNEPRHYLLPYAHDRMLLKAMWKGDDENIINLSFTVPSLIVLA